MLKTIKQRELRMKKHTLIAGLLTLCPISVIAADVPAYFVEFCDGSYSNTTVSWMCTQAPCSVSASGLTHTKSGSYTAYTHCAPIYVKSADQTYLLCFKDSDKCRQFSACHEDYMAAAKPDVTLTNYLSSSGLTYITNITDGLYQCCNGLNNGCLGVGGSVTNTDNIGTAKAKRCVQTGSNSLQCTTSTSSADTVAFCASGYYATGEKYVTIGTNNPRVAESRLKCTACPALADTYTDAARTVAATASTSPGADSASDCYLAAGTYYDKTGDYSFSNSCGFGQ